MAVLALVVIGALVVGTFMVGRLEARAGDGSLYAVQALEAARTGLTDGLANWDSTAASLPLGGTLPLPSHLPLAAGRSYRLSASRLGGRVYLLRSEGLRLDAGGGVLARRVEGLLVRADSAGGGGWVARPIRQRAWVSLY
jgi:hypothetical protein